MTALVDMLGARAIVQLRHPQVSPPSSRALYRGRIKRQLRTCVTCELHKTCEPVPFRLDTSTPKFVVVTETPNYKADETKLLRALMKEVEVDPDDALWCSTVACSGADRVPDSAREFCRVNMFDAIECGYVPFVMLVGAGAFRAFRHDLNITNHHGQMFIWLEQYAVMGVTNPAGATGKGKHFKGVIRKDLEFWREIVYGGDDPLAHLGIDCAQPKCTVRDVEHWDRDGVPWCKKHYELYGGQWKKERARWNVKIEQLSF